MPAARSAFGALASVDQLLAQIRRDLLAGLDQRLHRGDRLVELAALGAVELELDDALDALGADHHRHADVEILARRTRR